MLSTQSMMESSFLIATSLYSFVVAFLYAFVFLTLFFGSTIFRTASIPDCSMDDYDYDCRYSRFGERPVVSPYSRREVLTGQYNGNDVSVYAHFDSGGYEFIFGIVVVWALTYPGAVLSTAFLPGFKLTLVGISLVLLLACASPMILYATNVLNPYYLENCIKFNETISSETSFTLDNVGTSDFVDWVGVQITDPFLLCSPPVVSLLPQVGLFNTIALTLMSDVVFYSEPPEYAETFVANLQAGGESCSGNHCKFQYARQLYGKNLGYMFLGAMILLVIGLSMATLWIYPSSWMIKLKGKLCNCRKRGQGGGRPEEDEIEELPEVDEERQRVHSIMQQLQQSTSGQQMGDNEQDIDPNNLPVVEIEEDDEDNQKKSGNSISLLELEKQVANQAVDLEANDHLAINQDNVPPVVMHKLRKVFPPLGGSGPKVALNSLDLQVPKGEVLGLLGKNGAGKTTALKILAGIHEATDGVGLVAGYNCLTELDQVYENLGNCPQFDIVWKDQSVQRHLEFYARLKGIDAPNKAARDIADAVGLGAEDVYTRPSGALSGGMRRRLSIAVSLLGSPAVLLLDEPTTGKFDRSKDAFDQSLDICTI